jgi:hypothetical protein
VNLRGIAEADNAIILEDDVGGFGHPIKLTIPGSGVVGVKAVFLLLITGTAEVTIAAGTRWLIGPLAYIQNAAVTLSGDGPEYTATATVTAEETGAEYNQDEGTVAEREAPNGSVSSAAAGATTVQGVTMVPDTFFEVKGQYIRNGVEIDPETGLLVPGSRSAVTVRLSRLTSIPDEGWLIETTDSTGATVKGRATSVMLDRTAGRATMLFKR